MLCFTCRPGGILVCKLEGASFWEKTTGADYLPHTMTLPEGNVKIQRCEQMYIYLVIYFMLSGDPSYLWSDGILPLGCGNLKSPKVQKTGNKIS